MMTWYLTGSISFKFIDGKHAGKVTGTRNMDFIKDTNDYMAVWPLGKKGVDAAPGA